MRARPALYLELTRASPDLVASGSRPATRSVSAAVQATAVSDPPWVPPLELLAQREDPKAAKVVELQELGTGVVPPFALQTKNSIQRALILFLVGTN